MSSDAIQIREWQGLTYLDPERLLWKLREFEFQVLDSDLSPEVRHLRTNELKPLRELRDAALFSHGLAGAVGEKVLFSPDERSDYDFVTCCMKDATRHFSPVQLKEWVPPELNPRADLQGLIDGLKRKYRTSERTAVAIFVNRWVDVVFSDLDVSGLSVESLWLFGSQGADQSKWAITGNLLGSPRRYDFTYPWP